MIIGITGKAGSGKNTVGKMIQALDAGCNNKSILYLLEIAKDNQELNFENTSFQIKSFAFKIKQILCILTGCTMNQLENREFKEKKLPSQWKVWVVVIGKAPTIYERKVARTEEIAKNIVRENKMYGYGVHYYQWEPTYRDLLQYIGTDLFREQLHPDIWVNALFSDYIEHKPPKGISFDYAHTECIDCGKPFSGEKRQFICNNCHDTHNWFPNWIITDVRFSNEAKRIQKMGGKIIKLTRNINKEYNHPSEEYVPFIKEDYHIDNANQSLEQTLEDVKSKLITNNIIFNRAA